MAKNHISNWQLIFLGLIIVFSFSLKLYYNYYWPKAQVRINNQTLNVLVADNIKHWQKGLGGRKNLGKYDGMVFLFSTTGQHVFVMRDMHFPIDIVWIKGDMVVDIAPNVPLDFAKNEGDLLPYAARDVSDKVLELKAGMAEDLNLKIGDKVQVIP